MVDINLVSQINRSCTIGTESIVNGLISIIKSPQFGPTHMSASIKPSLYRQCLPIKRCSDNIPDALVLDDDE